MPTSEFASAHRQLGHQVRFGWGPTGAAALAGEVDVAVVVDVLSFTTTTTVALDAGATVIPSLWRDARSEELARERDAVLAVGRSRAGPDDLSLSPAHMRAHVRAGQRIVLPSPNGATLSYRLAAGPASCLAGCLRNAEAVARWIRDRDARRVAVVAAGERWPDGSLRPAVEDLWGAGAVLAGLAGHGCDLSVEAEVARAAYDAVADHLPDALLDCASGRELVAAGFSDDVEIASEVGASGVVPLLDDGAFVRAR